MEPEITLCRNADLPAVMAFFEQHWAAGHILARDEELLRWQFNPAAANGVFADGDLSILLVRDNDRLIGTLGLIPTDFNIFGTSVPAVWLAMLRTLQDSGVPGCGLKLMGAAQRYPFPVAATLGMNNTVEKLFRLLGYRIVVTRRHLAVIDPRKAAALAGVDEAALRPFFAAPAIPAAEAGELRIRQLPPGVAPGPEWDSFWRQEIAPHTLGAARHSRYLRWRYAEHPRFVYRILVAEDADGPAGLAVCRVEPVRDHPEWRVLRLVEWIGRPAALSALAARVLVIGGEEGAAFIDFFRADSAANPPELTAAGFHIVPDHLNALAPQFFQPLVRGAPAVLKGGLRVSPDLRRQYGALADHPALMLTRADCDQDRPN